MVQLLDNQELQEHWYCIIIAIIQSHFLSICIYIDAKTDITLTTRKEQTPSIAGYDNTLSIHRVQCSCVLSSRCCSRCTAEKRSPKTSSTTHNLNTTGMNQQWHHSLEQWKVHVMLFSCTDVIRKTTRTACSKEAIPSSTATLTTQGYVCMLEHSFHALISNKQQPYYFPAMQGLSSFVYSDEPSVTVVRYTCTT